MNGKHHGRMNETKAPKKVFENLGAKILLVEDNKVNQEITKSMLINMGCEVETAENGEVALTKALQNNFDLIFMDCQMPVLDGYEATEMIRAAEEASSSKDTSARIIIALTAYAMMGDRERCLSVGMNDYLSKPFTMDDLRKCLEKWLGTPEVNWFKQTGTTKSPQPDHSASPLDQTVIENIKALQQNGMPDILSELIQIYLSEAEDLIQDLSRAVDQHDTEKIYKTAHDLKSSSGNIGAITLADQCKVIEEKGRRQVTKRIMDDYNGVILEYQRVQSVLKEMLRGRGSET